MENIITLWNAMTEREQLDMITACITKALRNERITGHDTAEHVGGTWERVNAKLQPAKLEAENARRAAEGKAPITLHNLVYHAARAEITTEQRQTAKYDAARDWEIVNDHGESESYLAAMVSSGRDSTEDAAIIRADLSGFISMLDARSRTILNLMTGGYTEREIAPLMGISNVMVHKRIAKMREALRKTVA